MNHGAQPPQPPRGESPRAIAWTALLIALAALGVSVFVFLQNYDGGRLGEKLKANVKQARKEVEKAIDERAAAKNKESATEEAEPGEDDSGPTDEEIESADAAEGEASAEPSETGSAASGGGAFNLGRIKGRIDEARDMVARNSPQAKAYLDRLREELVTIRDYGTKKRDIALEKAISSLEDAKSKLEDDKDSAKESLQRLSQELGDQARKATGRAPEPEPAAEPESDHRWPGDDSARTSRKTEE